MKWKVMSLLVFSVIINLFLPFNYLLLFYNQPAVILNIINKPLRWNEFYCVYGNVLKKTIFDETITLILHSSDDKIDEELFSQIQNWNASVSLSIVLHSMEEPILDESASCILEKFSTMPHFVRSLLNVHLILPLSSPKQKCPILHLPDTCYCNQQQQNTTLSPSSSAFSSNQPYPANVARNVARYFTSSKFIVIADLDHYFSKNFEAKMRKLAKEIIGNHPKTVLVYRIFEVSSTIKKKEALTKFELKQLLLNNRARIFHSLFGRGHQIPYLWDWLKSNNNSENGIQFYTNYTMSEWEPQFVSNNDIPLHDESFPYPCKDNTVLRWEMCRASYNFAIVNDAFMYHKGIKSIKTKINIDRERYHIRRKAYSALKVFRKKMDKIYLQTRHLCPSFRV